MKIVSALWPLMVHPHNTINRHLRLGVPASFLAQGSFDEKPLVSEVYSGTVIGGCGGGLLSGADAHLVWLCDLNNIVVSRGHSRWCPAESKRGSLNTTNVTWQHVLFPSESSLPQQVQ